MPDILNTDMQIVVFDDLQFSLVFWSVPVIGNVILVQCVQINIKCEGSFCVLFLEQEESGVVAKFLL